MGNTSALVDTLNSLTGHIYPRKFKVMFSGCLNTEDNLYGNSLLTCFKTLSLINKVTSLKLY